MNEKGYSLILTMLIFLLFTVLSVSVLTVALSGVKRNQTSEDYVQARELANKGIEHITNQIQSDLKNELGEEGITRSEFITKLNTILNRYKDVINSVHNTGATGEYRVYIRNIENVIENGEENPLKKKITFLSRGFVDGRKKRLFQKLKLVHNLFWRHYIMRSVPTNYVKLQMPVYLVKEICFCTAGFRSQGI